jgi:hypothetical protein
MSSRLRAVGVSTLTYENVLGVPPEPSTPAADVPPRSRLCGVLIFEQNGALASTPCSFRFQAALELTAINCNVTVNFEHRSRSSRRLSMRRGRYINPNDIQIA